jgi:hypothetical protein
VSYPPQSGYDTAIKQEGGRTVAIIPQTRLFSWKDVENLGELKRLELVLKTIPDETLMRRLERERGRGRDDYPVRAVWNCVLAGVVYQHVSVESLRRELARNDRLRWMCGFDPLKDAEEAVPGPWAYSRFLRRLMKCQQEVDRIFDDLVEALSKELGGFGRHLACDSKGIATHARPRPRGERESLQPDGRRDLDADFGKKTYRGTHQDGTLWERTMRWFGYKLHLVVDSEHELPVAYEVTRASSPDNRAALRMLDDLEERHPQVLQQAEALMADKAYDDVKVLDKLWEYHGIAPIIPRREDWKQEPTRPLLPGADNITYDCQGQLYCYAPGDGRVRRMVYWGYEHSRDCQKWRCPWAVYGVQCRGHQECSGQSRYGRVVRVRRSKDRRTFTPVARPSYEFERLYAQRTAVERVNSRLDVSFGFERHFIRGMRKMRLRCSVALVVMLAMALGRIREKQPQRMRSLVAAA